MDEEKRMAGSYKVLYNIHIGDREVLFGENQGSTDMRYMVCFCDWNNPLGIENFTDAAGSNDYLEMMTEFNDRGRSQIEAVKSERDKITVPLEPFTLELCDQIKSDTELENTVAVIKPESLRPEYRTADKQLVFVTGGFGAHGNSRGRAVYTTNLYSEKKSRWNRDDILGVLSLEQMPEWAKKRFNEIEAKQKRCEPER